jgi:O-antigen/teichoic acid export membrane protein
MNTSRKILKNTGILFISQISIYVIGFFYIMYMARYLGPEGFGLLNFALAFCGIFGMVPDLGLSTLSVREVSRNKSLATTYLNNILSLRLILGIITFGLIFLTINILGYHEPTLTVVYIISVYVILAVFSQTFDSVVQANEKMEYLSLGQLITNIVLLLGTLLAIYYKLDVIGFAYIYIIAGAFNLLFYFILFMLKFFKPTITYDFKFWKEMIKNALPLSLSIVLILIAFKIDVIILSLLKGNEAVGIYTAAYKLIEILIFVPSIFAISVFPVLSNFHINSQNLIEFSYKKIYKYLCLLGLPIAVGTTLLANKIIFFIYSTSFYQTVITLQILIWVIPFIFLTYMSRVIMVSINKQDQLLKIIILYLILNIALNLIIIPIYGYIGAAIVTVVTEIVSFTLYYYYLSKFICKIQIYKYFSKPVIASAIMGLFVYYINLNLFLVIVIATIIYILVLIILKTFTEDDVNLLKSMIKG